MISLTRNFDIYLFTGIYLVIYVNVLIQQIIIMLNKQVLFLKLIKGKLLRVKKNRLKNFLNNNSRKLNILKKNLKHYPKGNTGKWNDLKDKYKGQRVFLIGNGPSLNKTPLYLLKGENTMCFNHFHLMLERINWKPKFYTIVDNLVLDDLLNEFEKVLMSSDSIFIPAVHHQGDVFVDRVVDDTKINWLKYGYFNLGFSTKLPNVNGGGSVIYEGFQILKHMGFSEIILLGVDMNYQIHTSVKSLKDESNNIESLSDNDPNHFDPRYFGKGKKYHQPESFVIQNILSSLKFLSEICEALDIKIINAGYDSKVEYFPKRSIYDILEIDEKKSTEIFEDCIRDKTNYSSLKLLKEQSKAIDQTDYDGLSDKENYYTDLDFGLGIIKKHVFTHVCYGPIDDTLYFVSRLNISNQK